jgi:hypothetical protein
MSVRANSEGGGRYLGPLGAISPIGRIRLMGLISLVVITKRLPKPRHLGALDTCGQAFVR